MAKLLSNAIVNCNARQVSGRKKAKTHCSIAAINLPSLSFITRALSGNIYCRGQRIMQERYE